MARRNPLIPFLGIDFLDGVELGFGVAATSVGNDKIMTPILNGILPSLYSNHTMAKVVDVVTTTISGTLAAWATGIVSNHARNRVAMGAAALVAAKTIGIFVPGYSLNASLPGNFQLSNPFVSAPASDGTKLLGPGVSDVAGGGPSLDQVGVGPSMGI